MRKKSRGKNPYCIPHCCKGCNPLPKFNVAIILVYLISSITLTLFARFLRDVLSISLKMRKKGGGKKNCLRASRPIINYR